MYIYNICVFLELADSKVIYLMKVRVVGEIREMKIQCDLCEKAEASLFCPSDEAALCYACDFTTHHANKLVSKHPRFSLLHSPSNNLSPLCDICKERRAYIFCKEDRAILCRECDIAMHRENKHSQKHNRFLLTSFKISEERSSTCCNNIINMKNTNKSSSPSNNYDDTINHNASLSSSSTAINVTNNTSGVTSGNFEEHMGISNNNNTSSISEYLMENIPGYRFEDLLDALPPFPPPPSNTASHYN